jgi:hypothetical protein
MGYRCDWITDIIAVIRDNYGNDLLSINTSELQKRFTEAEIEILIGDLVFNINRIIGVKDGQ